MIWTLIVEVPEDWGDPDELAEVLREVKIDVREMHYSDLTERPPMYDDLLAARPTARPASS